MSRRLRSAVRSLSAVLSVGIVIGAAGCAATPEPEYVPLRHPFRGATLYQDADIPAAHWQRTHDAAWLDPIVEQPHARWLTGPESLADLTSTVDEARGQGALLTVVAYHIPNRDCAGADQGAADAGAYGAWIDRVIDALGPTGAVVILEPDAVAAECLDDERAQMLAGAARALNRAGHYVYLDAGHPRWHDPEEMADRLKRAGIGDAEGFSVNVANRQSTPDSHRYAVRMSDLLGGREAIIDASRNGLDAPPDDEWCNSARQALGRPPTADPGLDRVAALLWVKSPGESDGTCGGGPEAGKFWPRQAQQLIAAAPWLPEPARQRAAAAPVR